VRILVVAPYPPRRCGIGTYARDQVERLRAEGHLVTVLSPPDGDGDRKAPFLGGRAFLVAARAGGRFDRIVVHFQPALYYRPRRPVSKVLTSLAFATLGAVRGRALEILVHEADPPARWRPDYLLLRQAFALAGFLTFHTRAEWHAVEGDYRLGRRRDRVSFVPHVVAPAGPVVERNEARARLGIAPTGGPVLVCAGFLQPAKGFERAVRAFSTLAGTAGANGVSSAAEAGTLYVVGSVRDRTPETEAYAASLKRLCEATPGTKLVEGFLSDQEFDLWVAAADRLVLPYRSSWSSGLLARAHALGTPAIVSATGGLREQAGEDDVVFDDDEGLVEAVREAIGVAR